MKTKLGSVSSRHRTSSSKNKTLAREKVSSVVFCGAQHVGVRA